VAGIPRKGRRGDGDPSTEAKFGLDLLDQEVNWTKIAVTLRTPRRLISERFFLSEIKGMKQAILIVS